jgi:hypothetical protein
VDFWTTVTTIVTTLGTIGVVVAPFWKWVRNFTKSWELFMRDWSGEEARPGHDKEPGVMERLNNLDGQFKKNGGGSMKDSLDRIERKISSIDKRLTEGEQRFNNIENQVGIEKPKNSQ